MDSQELFSPKLESMRYRMRTLHQEISSVPSLPVEALVATFTELTLAFEELQVAQEQLSQQNHELELTRTALEDERERYRELFELAPDGYVVTDENAKIQEANLAAAELLNIAPNFLVNKLLGLFVIEEERRLFRSRLNQLKAGQIKRFRNWEMGMRSRQGYYLCVDVSVSAVRQGKNTALHWLIRDISDRKQTEEKLSDIGLQNLALQKAAKLKAQFLSTMSHELRTPMNAIIGFSQILLRQRQANNLEPIQTEMLRRIFQNGQHLLALINHILEISKIESGHLQLKLDSIDVMNLLTQLTQELSSLLEEKNLSLTITTNLSNPIIINDSLRLRQILTNLLANAIKFTETGGIKIEVYELENDPDQIVISVNDTGIGIAAEHLESIFEPFQQVEQHLARHFAGTGLGLAICKSLVGLMQGKIRVESLPGVGSTFCIELPRQVTIKSSFL